MLMITRALSLRLALLALLLLALAPPMSAQERYPTHFSPRIAQRPAVRDALGWLERNFP